MRIIEWKTLLLVAALLFSPLLAAQQRYEGLAYASGSQRLLYRETHWDYLDHGVASHLVLYRCPGGAAFARKWLRESPSAIAPDFDFIDARSGYREGVRTRAGTREVYVRKSATAAPKAKPLPSRANAVIDGGFDAFVRGHWDRFNTDTPVKAAFLLPSRFGYLDFRITRVEDTQSGGETLRHLKMRIDSLLGLVLPELALTYSVADHRLRRFQGIGTIRDDKGRNQDVRIEFPVVARKADVAQGEIDAATTMPLVARCRN